MKDTASLVLVDRVQATCPMGLLYVRQEQWRTENLLAAPHSASLLQRLQVHREKTALPRGFSTMDGDKHSIV